MELILEEAQNPPDLFDETYFPPQKVQRISVSQVDKRTSAELATKEELEEVKQVVLKLGEKSSANSTPFGPKSKKRKFWNLSKEDRNRAFKEGLCFHCMKQGHRADDCEQNDRKKGMPRGNARNPAPCTDYIAANTDVTVESKTA